MLIFVILYGNGSQRRSIGSRWIAMAMSRATRMATAVAMAVAKDMMDG